MTLTADEFRPGDIVFLSSYGYKSDNPSLCISTVPRGMGWSDSLYVEVYFLKKGQVKSELFRRNWSFDALRLEQ